MVSPLANSINVTLFTQAIKLDLVDTVKIPIQVREPRVPVRSTRPSLVMMLHALLSLRVSELHSVEILSYPIIPFLVKSHEPTFDRMSLVARERLNNRTPDSSLA